MNTIKIKEESLPILPTRAKDIKLYKFPEALNRIHPDPSNALHILKQHNYESKVFCNSDIRAHTSDFEVKGNKWNWVVSPVGIKNIEQIPYEFLEGINILLDNNVKIEGVAIAKPKPKEDVFGVIKQELYYGLETLSKVGIFIFLLISSSMKKTVKVIERVSNNVSSPSLINIPDPVLLVRVKDKWIEVGRWV